MLRMLSLCAGIGGADLAAEWTDKIEVVGQVEKDPFCQIVLSKHWPRVKRLSDIKDVNGDEFGQVDLVVGGIPCQPFSSAGKQHGTNDDRYLWPDMFRIVQATRPAWVVLENVDDLTYMALDIVQADLESKDYTVQAFVLPACAVGAPHERQRCFVVAYSASRGREKQQTAGRLHDQSNAPGPLSDADGNRQRLRAHQQECQPWSVGQADARPHGPQELMADTDSQGPQIRDGCPGQAWAPAATDRCSSRELESRMGRVLARLSSRLDSHRWPALPGYAQESWEPARTVTGRQPYRSQRLKALGNAIVPAQIYPLFECIVAMENTNDE